MKKIIILFFVWGFSFLPLTLFAGAKCFPASNGFKLTSGQAIESPNDQFKFTLQSDGNLVLRQLKSDGSWAAIYATATNQNAQNPQNYVLYFQPDGNLVLYNNDSSNHKSLWATNTHGYPNASLCFQNHGNLVIYDSPSFKSRKAIWQSNTNSLALHFGSVLNMSDSSIKIMNSLNEPDVVNPYEFASLTDAADSYTINYGSTPVCTFKTDVAGNINSIINFNLTYLNIICTSVKMVEKLVDKKNLDKIVDGAIITPNTIIVMPTQYYSACASGHYMYNSTFKYEDYAVACVIGYATKKAAINAAISACNNLNPVHPLGCVDAAGATILQDLTGSDALTGLLSASPNHYKFARVNSSDDAPTAYNDYETAGGVETGVSGAVLFGDSDINMIHFSTFFQDNSAQCDAPTLVINNLGIVMTYYCKK